MRNFLAITMLILLSSARILAQDGQSHTAIISGKGIDSLPKVTKPARDFLMVQFGYANWTTRPDTVDVKKFSYTFNAFLCYDFPIKKSHFSFATGVGISTTSIYLDKQLLAVSDTGAKGVDASFVPDTANYKRYKFNTAYVQAPFELRYFSNKDNRNKGWKLAMGLQVGTSLGGHTKGLRSVQGTNIKDKLNTKRYISPWNFAATARIGWGNFSAFGSYNITPVFKDNSGPPLTPMSVGICFTGL
jgi:hypothetical protein